MRNSTVKKLSIFISTVIFAFMLFLSGIFTLPLSKDSNKTIAAVDLGTDTGNKVRNVLRNNLVNFTGLQGTQSVGTLSYSGSYNIKNRGVENKNAGEALAYTDLDRTGTAGSTRSWMDTYGSLQVWIGVGGELAAGINNGIIGSLNFDFAYSMGVLVSLHTGWAESSGQWGTTISYFDIGFERMTSSSITRTSSSYGWDITNQFIQNPGEIYSGSRDVVQQRNDKSKAFGLTPGLESVDGHNSWGNFYNTNVVIDGSNLARVGEQGGFFVRIFTFSTNWSSTSAGLFGPKMLMQQCSTFEGVRVTPVLADKETTFYTNDPINGNSSVETKFYEKQLDATLSFYAPLKQNLYFTGWAGSTVASDASCRAVTTSRFDSTPQNQNTITANYNYFPLNGGTSYNYNKNAQGPSVNVPQGHSLANENYAGRNGTFYEAQAKPTDVGEYTYNATLIRNGETVGQLSYDFAIYKGDSAGTEVELDSWQFGEQPKTPLLVNAPDELGEVTFEYQVNQQGQWVQNVPEIAGTHNVRACVAESENYNAFITPAAEFSILQKTLNNSSLTLSESYFAYNGGAQVPEIVVKDGNVTLTENVDYIISEFNKVNAGTKTVEVIFIGNYTGTASKTYEIAKIDPQIPKTNLTAIYGSLLSSVLLPSDWEWSDGNQLVGNAGINSFYAVFAGDLTNYNNISVLFEVVVSKANSIVNPKYIVPQTLWTTSELPALSLSEGDTLGIIEWNAHMVFEGEFAYGWTFTPFSSNFEITSGEITFTAITPQITGLALAMQPNKVNYTAFETFDATGLIVEVLTEDGLAAEIADYSVMYQSGNNSFRFGETKIIVGYNGFTLEIAITVEKADPVLTVPNNLHATYGNLLSSVLLPLGWAWADETQTVGSAGTNLKQAIFTPDDSSNFNSVLTELEILVAPAQSIVSPQFEMPQTLWTTSELPALSLSEGDTLGTISWNAYTITQGENSYSWTFVPHNSNFTTVTGAVLFTAQVPQISEIVLVSNPAKTHYKAFETLNTLGLAVEIITQDGMVAGTINFANEQTYLVVYEGGNTSFRFGETKVTLVYNNLTLDILITVEKADPIYIVPSLSAERGDTLSLITLPEGWAWIDETQTVGEGETAKFEARFTPEDTINYNIIVVELVIAVKAKPIEIPEVETEKTTNTITVNIVMLLDGFELEYSISTSHEVPASGWQSSPTFSGLEENTEYFVFIRLKPTSGNGAEEYFSLIVKTDSAYSNIAGESGTGTGNGEIATWVSVLMYIGGIAVAGVGILSGIIIVKNKKLAGKKARR